MNNIQLRKRQYSSTIITNTSNSTTSNNSNSTNRKKRQTMNSRASDPINAHVPDFSLPDNVIVHLPPSPPPPQQQHLQQHLSPPSLDSVLNLHSNTTIHGEYTLQNTKYDIKYHKDSQVPEWSDLEKCHLWLQQKLSNLQWIDNHVKRVSSTYSSPFSSKYPNYSKHKQQPMENSHSEKYQDYFWSDSSEYEWSQILEEKNKLKQLADEWFESIKDDISSLTPPGSPLLPNTCSSTSSNE